MPAKQVRVLFLHHSTGEAIWNGNTNNLQFKFRQVINKLSGGGSNSALMLRLFRSYNKKHSVDYRIEEMNFPKKSPYGWKNDPFDYYNIWVAHSGKDSFMSEPTLEILTGKYDVIMWKHCFPVSNIQADADSNDINSDYKSIGNYKLQYLALRDKMHQFPDTKFIVWTGAVKLKSDLSEAEAGRMNSFYKWVVSEWDVPGDNIYLWDFYGLETEGGLFLKPEYAYSAGDSHPNLKFSDKACRKLFNRITDIIENEGKNTKLDGTIN